jgi:ABC-type polysaccharide/polyol phosphate transport system ATPase subunit
MAPKETVCAAVEVRNLTKMFRIHHRGSLKQALLRRLGGKDHIEMYTALRDISFTVPHGQTLAVVGRNGSGKSTLLGLLARVYKPTSGTTRLSAPDGSPARVAPLLELGAGFHHELTGLENIGFYGALLGMTAKQLRERTEAIVDFAELAQKVDTPLYGWNDGAKLRLGFSIAVHTDPDILLVDEVLAVGDEAFQNKCYKRIGELQAQGKTILFVSHDLAVVERVANRILWLNQGEITLDGDVDAVLKAYRAASI